MIMGAGGAFADFNNPRAVVQVGAPGSIGLIEITDMVFTTRAPGTSLDSVEENRMLNLLIAAGAIIGEWNVHEPEGQQGGAGTWDTHLM